jgi:hypothetical protein
LLAQSEIAATLGVASTTQYLFRVSTIATGATIACFRGLRRSAPITGGDLLDIFDNIADMTDKVGFGIVAYARVKAISQGENGETTGRQAQE